VVRVRRALSSACPAPPTDRPESSGPTAKQLRYPRTLADSRGQTFTYPRAKAQASTEIRRLEQQTEQSRLERAVERDRLQREVELPADATQVREGEVCGHGANCQWSHSTRGPKSA
jgi:hypothetical protein